MALIASLAERTGTTGGSGAGDSVGLAGFEAGLGEIEELAAGLERGLAIGFGAE